MEFKFDKLGKLSIPPLCKCGSSMGLQITGKEATWICPHHGAQMWIAVSRLNGCKDEAKVGGTQ